MDSHFQHGIDLLNQGRYFDAHEALEDVWRESTGDQRRFLQGLTQLAVGLHHHSTGNLAGARGVLARAASNLGGYPDRYRGIDLAALKSALETLLAALDEGRPAPATIHIGRASE